MVSSGAVRQMITEAILAHMAAYVGGGTRAGSVVTWTLGSLPPDASATLSFVVTATGTITNSDYRVTVDGRLAAVGQAAMVTIVADEAGGEVFT
jgi:hypothetical protein